MKNLTNFHVLTVNYLGATNTLPSRVSIKSERFKESKVINFTYELDNTQQVAQNYLERKGFELIGKAEGKDCYYIISSTFKSIK